MTRTEKAGRKLPAVKDLKQESTVASIRRSSRLKKVVEQSAAEPSLYRCSDKISREIHQLQNSTDLLIPKKPFVRIAREMGKNFKTNVSFKPVTFIGLQEMSEAHLTDIFKKKDMLTKHARRATMRPCDEQLNIRLQ